MRVNSRIAMPKTVVIVLVTASLCAYTAVRAADPADALQEIVVTGTFIPISKQLATTAISTVSAAEIDRLVPVNALDLLSNVPGVFVDTSQGSYFFNTAVGTQVTSRGLSFIVLEEDGLPLEAAANLGTYGSSASLLRADATLEQIQVVRGGSAAITGANAPGGIFNYISKTGGDVLRGEVNASYGRQGNGKLPYERVEFDLGGPLAAQGLYFNIGGYYQHDYGTHDIGYASDKGGQIKANILKKFDNATLEVYAKYLDDHNGFQVTQPTRNWNSPTPAPGWSNTTTPLMGPVSFGYQNGPNSFAHYDQGDGIETISESIGVKFDAKLGAGFSISNNFKFSFNQANLQFDNWGTQSALGDGFMYSLFGTGSIPGTYTFRNPATGASAQVASDGTTFTVLNNNLPGTPGVPDTVMLHGATIQHLTDHQIEDQFSVTEKLDNMAFTAGAYYAHLDAVSQPLQLVGNGASEYLPNANLLDITLKTPSRTLQVTNSAGFGPSNAANGNFPHASWDQIAMFFGHSWSISDKWALDYGVRYEHVRVNAYNDSGADQQVLGYTDNNVYSNSYGVFAPLFHIARSIGTLAYSGALNRIIDENNSLYLRYSLGKKSPDLGFYQGLNSGTPDALTSPVPQKVVQWELGYKYYKGNFFSLDVTPYYSVLTSPGATTLTTVNSDGTPGFYVAYTPANKTSDYGIELDSQLHFNYGFGLRAALTWQYAKQITSYTWTQPNGPGPSSAPLSNAVLLNNSAGLKAQNIPGYMATLTPSYTVGPLTAQVQWQYMGQRAANNYDAFTLPAYQQTNLTLQWNFSSKWALSFTENNLFNSGGIVEWAPPGDVVSGFFQAGSYTRAQVLANPNATFAALQIPARAYFLRVSYKP